MVSAVCGGIRVVSLYAPNGRVVGSPFYEGKLRWFERLRRWLDETGRRPTSRCVLGGDLNATPTDDDVWDAVRGPRRDPRLGARASRPRRPSVSGASIDAYRQWQCRMEPAASRGGTTGPACSTGTRACGSICSTSRSPSPSGSSGPRSTARRARVRRSRPITPRSSSISTSAGVPFDAGWEGAFARIAGRSRPGRKSPARPAPPGSRPAAARWALPPAAPPRRGRTTRLQRRVGVGQRQQIVEEDAVVAGPGEMLGEQRRLGRYRSGASAASDALDRARRASRSTGRRHASTADSGADRLRQ